MRNCSTLSSRSVKTLSHVLLSLLWRVETINRLLSWGPYKISAKSVYNSPTYENWLKSVKIGWPSFSCPFSSFSCPFGFRQQNHAHLAHFHAHLAHFHAVRGKILCGEYFLRFPTFIWIVSLVYITPHKIFQGVSFCCQICERRNSVWLYFLSHPTFIWMVSLVLFPRSAYAIFVLWQQVRCSITFFADDHDMNIPSGNKTKIFIPRLFYGSRKANCLFR